MNTKKAVFIVAGSGIAAFVIGAILFSCLNLGDSIAVGTALAQIVGTSAGSFGMRLCLIAVLSSVFLVPSIRAEFTGSYSAGTDYKKSSKRGRGRI